MAQTVILAAVSLHRNQTLCVEINISIISHTNTHIHAHTHTRTHTRTQRNTHHHLHTHTHTHKDTHKDTHTQRYTHTNTETHTQGLDVHCSCVPLAVGLYLNMKRQEAWLICSASADKAYPVFGVCPARRAARALEHLIPCQGRWAPQIDWRAVYLVFGLRREKRDLIFVLIPHLLPALFPF